MGEMEFFCKMIIALVEAEEEDSRESMRKDDNINIGFNYKGRKYNVVITVEEGENG